MGGAVSPTVLPPIPPNGERTGAPPLAVCDGGGGGGGGAPTPTWGEGLGALLSREFSSLAPSLCECP